MNLFYNTNMTNKKNLLIIAHYYYPDVASTGQIYKDIADNLKDEFNVSILCTVPSYTGYIEDKYKDKDIYIENIDGVKVYRVRVSEFDKKNKISRVKNILSYYFRARKLIRSLKDIDCILALSQPPVLGGMIGVYGKKKLNCKLIYNIQDFNPEQIMAINFSKNKLIIDILMYLDKRTCKKSDLIITVGKDLVETVNKRFNYKDVPNTIMINNWIDDEKIYPLDKNNDGVLEFKNKYNLNNKFIIMYSGNIGLYYDLENIIKVIEKIKDENILFVFVGEGAKKNTLVDYVNSHNMNNVVFIPYQNKEDLIYSLNAADVHLCINAKGIKGVSCPSKFYGIAAIAKPVIGVLEKGSEIYSIIDKTKCGLLSEPNDYDKLEENIREIVNRKDLDIMGNNGYEYLKKYLTKKEATSKYKEAIKNLL